MFKPMGGPYKEREAEGEGEGNVVRMQLGFRQCSKQNAKNGCFLCSHTLAMQPQALRSVFAFAVHSSLRGHSANAENINVCVHPGTAHIDVLSHSTAHPKSEDAKAGGKRKAGAVAQAKQSK